MANVLVTGANRGIGLAFVAALRADGHTVWGVCRSASDELRELTPNVVEGADMLDGDVGDFIAKALGDTKLDLLIANAGILTFESLEDLAYERITRQFEVNAVGPLRVVEGLLPNLVSGSKIALITSRMGSIEDNTSGGYYGYRMSKAALNAAGMSLAHDLQDRGIAVGILHPGLVATEMTNNSGISPDESVAGLLTRINALTLRTTGTFWHANGDVLPW